MPEKSRIISFAEVPEYVNQGGRNQLCRDLLGKGELGHVGIGHNVMRANACNGLNTHASWHQVFVVTKGQGTVVLNGVEYRVKAPCVVTIHAGVEHDVITGEKEHIEYVYVNDHLEIR